MIKIISLQQIVLKSSAKNSDDQKCAPCAPQKRFFVARQILIRPRKSCKPLSCRGFLGRVLEQVTGIEPGYSAWNLQTSSVFSTTVLTSRPLTAPVEPKQLFWFVRTGGRARVASVWAAHAGKIDPTAAGEAHKLVELLGLPAPHQYWTWIKPPPFGLGRYFRNSTEQILFATLGETKTRPAAASIRRTSLRHVANIQRNRKHSYDIVRAASYPPYGEGNQRQPRPDFTNLYCPVTEQGKNEAAE